MKILVLVAMDKELRLLSEILKNKREDQNNEIIIGGIGKNEIILTKCGIGKVNAALKALQLINKFKPDLVINSGVAGGTGLPIGTVLVADKVAYHDVWCGEGTVYGKAEGQPLYFEPDPVFIKIAKNEIMNKKFETGLLCSGDKFISTKAETDYIKNQFPEVKGVDMESAAIAHTCNEMKVPFNIIRIISDTPGKGENLSQYKNFWEDAPRESISLISEIFSHL